MKEIILTDDEIKLIKRKRKEKADYNKIMSEKPISYTGKSKGKIILRAQCKIRNRKGDIWCEFCMDRDTCTYVKGFVFNKGLD